MLYISVLVLDIKMGKSQKVFTTEPILIEQNDHDYALSKTKQRNIYPNQLLYTRPTFSKSLMVSVAMSGENICELVFAHRDESLKFILACALSEEAPYFLWTKCADLTFD